MEKVINTTSPKFKLNFNDFLHALKNVLIFALPIALANIDGIQNWCLATLNMNPEVFAIVFSALIKLGEYFVKDNKPTV